MLFTRSIALSRIPVCLHFGSADHRNGEHFWTSNWILLLQVPFGVCWPTLRMPQDANWGCSEAQSLSTNIPDAYARWTYQAKIPSKHTKRKTKHAEHAKWTCQMHMPGAHAKRQSGAVWHTPTYAKRCGRSLETLQSVRHSRLLISPFDSPFESNDSLLWLFRLRSTPFDSLICHLT